MVKGVIGCNEFIVASLTDPPLGQPLQDVTDPLARQRAVAFTLAAKDTEEAGLVMAFVLFAFPVIAQMIKVSLEEDGVLAHTLKSSLLIVSVMRPALSLAKLAGLLVCSPHQRPPCILRVFTCFPLCTRACIHPEPHSHTGVTHM